MIPFVDLKAQMRRIEAPLRERIERVLQHGQFVMGPEVAELEQVLAERVGVSHVVSCSSGTDALLLPLMARGVGPGDAIFTTPFTFIATAEVISLLRATPVFVDIDPDTFNIDPRALRREIDRVRTQGRLRPRGIIPVDLFGLPADYEQINAIAAAEGLFVVEDAAQSFGASYRGRAACALAEAAATSFFPAKPLGCYGDGGAVLTNDPHLADLMRSIRVHGMGDDKYANDRIGLNGRLDTLQAAILLTKLEIFDSEIDARNRVAARYCQLLPAACVVQRVPAHCRSAWAQFSFTCDNRDELAGRLKARGIPTAIYYPVPLHRQKAFAGLGYGANDFPVANEVSARILSLPIHPYLEESQMESICGAMREVLGE